jgi:serine/threonine protein kinase
MADQQTLTIGRYRVLDKIGTGSSGDVYHCHDPILKRDVAVKVPLVTLGHKELKGVVEKFYHEAEIAAQFQHANIVTVYDVGGNLPETDDQTGDAGAHFLVMELAKGTNLKDYLQLHEQLPLEESLNIIFECCKALDYIHFRGVIHRDIKPANIIYDPETGTVKLTDFSIADYQDNSTREKQIGTLPYSSPEHFLADKQITPQTDIFALGSVMYQMLTGYCPFTGSNIDDVASQIVSSHPGPVREFRNDIPIQVEFILLKAMSKSQRDRFQNAVEFTDAVSLALRTIGAVPAKADKNHRKDAEIDEYLILRHNSWFREFSPDQIDELVRSGNVLSYEPGEQIVCQGDVADSFYTLLEGEAEVIKDEQYLNTLKPGACFGELGHLTRAHERIASIRAAGPVRVLAVNTDKLQQLSPESQAGFYKAFLTITMERLIELNEQLIDSQ